MGDHITGMKSLKEISATVKGANEHCVKLFTKSFGAQPTPTPKNPADQPDPASTEESVMDANIIKSFAGLQARTGTTGALYVAQLEDDKVKSFFEQDAAAQDAEVKTWDDAEKAKAADLAEKEKAKSAGDPAVSSLKAELDVLKSERAVEKAAARQGELREIAKSKFGLVPGAVEVLKSIDNLSADEQKPSLALLERQQEFAKRAGDVFGDDEAVAGDATAKHDALVADVAKTKNITKAAALLEVANDPEHQDLINQMRAEMAG